MSTYKRSKEPGAPYWIRFKWNGREIRQSSGTSNRQAAKEIESTMRINLAKGDAGIEVLSTVPTLAEYKPRFMSYVEAHAKKAGSIDFYRENLRQLLRFPELAACRLDAIDGDLIDRFVAFRRRGEREVKLVNPEPPQLKPGQRYSAKRERAEAPLVVKNVTPATINRALATLRRVVNVAEKRKVIKRAPKIDLLPGERSREFVLQPHEEAAYFALCPATVASIARLSLLTSLRAGECRMLEWSDVELEGVGSVDRAFIRVHHTTTKNGKGRIVPLSTDAVVFLRGLPRNGRRVLGDTFPLLTSIARSHARIRRKLGHPSDFVIHSMRHTALTRFGESGIDIYSLQAIAGHASITTTQKYVHPVSEHIARSMDKFDARSRVIEMPRQRRA